ncbi:MAG: hypothetical protein Alpg2KO_05350 [Alphaproteobacteria bacterium]
MRQALALCLTIALTMLTVTSAHAQAVQGEPGPMPYGEYLKLSETYEGQVSLDWYLNGLRDSLMVFELHERELNRLTASRDARAQSLYCVPDQLDISISLIKQMIAKSPRPVERDFPFRVTVPELVHRGLAETFPCR